MGNTVLTRVIHTLVTYLVTYYLVHLSHNDNTNPPGCQKWSMYNPLKLMCENLIITLLDSGSYRELEPESVALDDGDGEYF